MEEDYLLFGRQKNVFNIFKVAMEEDYILLGR